jgi:hypothetical protein
VTDDFEVTPTAIDQFVAYVATIGIQPGPAEWASEGDYLRIHIKAEIFNQAFGVARGDEIELPHDPVVMKALEILGS